VEWNDHYVGNPKIKKKNNKWNGMAIMLGILKKR